jgi:N utilization substance protein B
MARRRRAREVVLQVLYQDDVNPESMAESDGFLRRRLHSDEDLREFAGALLKGTRDHRDEIDRLLTHTAVNWTLRRMAVTDRNILRLGGYEILFGGTPPKAAINEAVDLAKRYGSENSPQFVNGILDKLLAKREGDQGAEVADRGPEKEKT